MSALADRLRAALEDGASATPELLSGDGHDVVPPDEAPLAPAAVLVAVTDRAEPGVILTQRTETLRRHAGQVAFPGGRIDAGEDAVAAALREAEEEIGLPRGVPHVLGPIDRYRTGTGFEVTPVLAVVPPDLPVVPSAAEVAEVFEVPLAVLLDPARHRAASAEWRGRLRHFYEIDWQGHRIWGATAGMIVNLSRRLAWPR